MRYAIASSKEWFFKSNKSEDFLKYDFSYLKEKDSLNLESLQKINPRYIFFPHWSWVVPSEIYEKYECVVFHTAPLPFGRGGSPIQNLIVRGFEKAPVCAIRMNDVLDGGAIYKSIEISLAGKCEEILERMAEAIQLLIIEIVKGEIKPTNQVGEPLYFKRRNQDDNRLPSRLSNLNELYDRIRMLDADDYPKAFIEYGNAILEFSDAVELEGFVEAKVRFKLNEDKQSNN